jgi:hypothetical protein
MDTSAPLADVSALRSLKWRRLAAEELARPCSMTLRAVLAGPRVLDFAWEVVDVGAARMLHRTASTLVGQRLLEVLAGQPGHRHIFDHYRRVFETGLPEAALQLHTDHGNDDLYRHSASRRGDAVAVTLVNLSAARRARCLQAAW